MLNRSHTFPRIVAALLFVAVLVGLPSVARADDPTDGRINRIPWVNSFGAVVVYCLDSSGHAAGNRDGGMSLTDATGNVLMKWSAANIAAKSALATQTGQPQIIPPSGPIYTLYALPGGWFQLVSIPDKEGKTFIGKWYGCTPIGSGPGPVAPTSTPCIRPEGIGFDGCIPS